jgi:hypothetical protein
MSAPEQEKDGENQAAVNRGTIPDQSAPKSKSRPKNSEEKDEEIGMSQGFSARKSRGTATRDSTCQKVAG